MSDERTTTSESPSGAPTDRATFYGVHYRDITGHKQVAIPKPLKRVIDDAHEDKLLLMRWQKEPFLRLYTKRQFDKKLDEVKENPAIPLELRASAATWMAKAAEPVEPDSQGRFVVPTKWIEALGFTESVAFCGAFTYIEVWPAQAYRESEEAEPAELAHVAKALTNTLNM